MRKVLGGGMRQSGVIAAAGLVALDKMIDRLQLDHKHIYEIAKGDYSFIFESNFVIKKLMFSSH